MTRQDDDHKFAYIGRDEHGCLVAARVDMGDEETGEDVAEFIKDGLTIERVTCDYVRAADWGCKHKPQQETMPV